MSCPTCIHRVKQWVSDKLVLLFLSVYWSLSCCRLPNQKYLRTAKMSFLVWISKCSNCQDCSGWLLWLLSMLPIFLERSESLSKVFIIVLSWLITISKHINPLNWGRVFLAYGNMCQLNGLNAEKIPQPWPSPWGKAWTCIKKVIDNLHIWNHKDASCREAYSPATLKKQLPEGNTMAVEQTVCSSLGLRKLCVPCEKSTIYFTYIVW